MKMKKGVVSSLHLEKKMLRTNRTKGAIRPLLTLLPCLFSVFLFAGTASARQAPPGLADRAVQLQPAPVPPGYRIVELGSGGLTGFSTFNSSDQIAVSFEDDAGFSRAFFYDGQSVSDIGTLGGTHSYVSGLNERGEVAGHSFVAGNTNFRAFIWSKQGGMRDLGTLDGTGSSTAGHVTPINNRTQVVGESTRPGAQPQAYFWSATQGMRALGGLPGNPTGFSIAHAVNDTGTVAGHGTAAGGETHAFVWTRRRGMIDLGTLGGTISVAAGLSRSGMVVGNSSITSGLNHMFVWTRTGGMRDVGTATGVESFTSEKPMSSNGNVAGLIRFADGTDHAALWTGATGLLDLGTFGGPSSFANGVNNFAQVVGAADITLAERTSFIWTVQEGMIDLNARLCQPPRGLSLGAGLAISDTGVIFASTNQGFVLLKPGCE
jgi:probable HAF family extracellular repeat protein